MFSGNITFLSISTNGHHIHLWRSIGLGLMGMTALVTLVGPRWMTDERRARAGQVAIGIYTFILALATAGLAFASEQNTQSWFRADGLSDPGIFSILSLALMFGATLAVLGTYKLQAGSFNVALAVGIPAWILGILDTLVIGYFWLGPDVPVHGRGLHSALGGRGPEVLALVTAFVAVMAAALSLRRAIDYRELRPLFARGAMFSLFGAGNEVLLLIARGPGMWHTGLDLRGADLIFSSILIGVLVYLFAYLSTGRQEDPEPAPALAQIYQLPQWSHPIVEGHASLERAA